MMTSAVPVSSTACTPGDATAAPRRFPPHERRLMLSEPGIGPVVLERLEHHGFDSLAALRRGGVEHAVHAVCASQSSRAFGNRRRALERVLARAG